jgi:hypothetical protein
LHLKDEIAILKHKQQDHETNVPKS